MQTAGQAQTFVRDFHNAGFGVVRQAIEPSLANDLRTRLDRMFDDRPASEPAPLQRIVPRIIECDERFAGLATSPAMVATLTEIFGVIPQLVCSYGHQKPARTGAHTRPHSDVAHLPGVPHHLSLLMVKAMFALTAVTTGSGGTMIFPRSHRQPPGAGSQDGPGHYVALEPGDLLLFHANVRHTATENSSLDARLSVWFMYALPWMRLFPGYEYSDEFLRGVRQRTATEPHLTSIFGLNDPYATSAALQ
ncbi:MAG: phytanoyl-CoA dioxygenase family protein [Streptosporangiaceae bacterium]|nr:phytanoyl-CoA dioxygenase family protein [Pseudonocardiales bacterium]MBV9446860.1 phytanoyl-CoA dioxygenase family protein [Streptosporangiaceae bacterium]